MGWCHAGAFCVQQYPPSVSLAACSKEAGPLCLCQPPSLAPFVKVNKLVCSGTALSYGGEHKSRKEEIIRSWHAGSGGLGKVEGRRMREWWTLERSIVLFLLLHPFFLPEQHLFTVTLHSFTAATARCTRALAAEGLAAPTALTHARSSEGDIFQERLQLPVFPLGFPAPKWSRTPPPPPLKYPSALRLLTQLSFCYQFTTPVKEEAQAYYLNSPSAGWYGPGVEERKPGSGFDSLCFSDFGFELK